MGKLILVISQALNVPVELLGEESGPESLPQWDSVAHWQVIAAVEKAFSVDFTMDEAASFNCIGRIRQALDTRGATGA